jgi:hypothetical protein
VALGLLVIDYMTVVERDSSDRGITDHHPPPSQYICVVGNLDLDYWTPWFNSHISTYTVITSGLYGHCKVNNFALTAIHFASSDLEDENACWRLEHHYSSASDHARLQTFGTRVGSTFPNESWV